MGTINGMIIPSTCSSGQCLSRLGPRGHIDLLAGIGSHNFGGEKLPRFSVDKMETQESWWCGIVLRLVGLRPGESQSGLPGFTVGGGRSSWRTPSPRPGIIFRPGYCRENLPEPWAPQIVIKETLLKSSIKIQGHTYWVIDYNNKKNSPGASESQQSACNGGDLCLIPGLRRSHRRKMATHSQYSCLKSPWIEQPGRLQSAQGLQRVEDLAEWLHMYIAIKSDNDHILTTYGFALQILDSDWPFMLAALLRRLSTVDSRWMQKSTVGPALLGPQRPSGDKKPLLSLFWWSDLIFNGHIMK